MQVTKRGAIVALLAASGGAIGRDMVSWVIAKAADAVWAGRPRTVTWDGFPWQNTIGAICLCAALIVALWPTLVRLWLGRPVSEIAYDDTQIRNEVADLTKTVRAVIDDYQRMSAVEIRLMGEIDGVKLAIQTSDKSQYDNALMATRNVTDLRKDIKKSLDGLYKSLWAIRAREIESRCAKVVAEKGKILTDTPLGGLPTKGDSLSQWQEQKVEYDSALEKWIDICQCWHKDLRSIIDDIDNTLLTDRRFDYVDGLFPSARDDTLYKIFALRHANYLRIRTYLHDTLEIAAFAGAESESILANRSGVVGS